MKAKEKAQEIYNHYFILVRFTMEDCSFTYRGLDYEMCLRRTAKSCASREVEELLNQSWDYRTLDNSVSYNSWLEVKTELEKL